MGIPAPYGVSACGLPPLGDQANAVVSGALTAVGPTAPFSFRGPMNFELYASILATTLTTTAGSLAATVSSGTGLAAGASINSANVPPGATVGVLSGTNVTLALPPRTYPCSGLSLSAAALTLPPGSNVSQLLGATVTVPSNAEGVTLPAGTTVIAIHQADVAPSGISPGTPGIIELSAAPTAIPADPNPRFLQFAPTGNGIVTSASGAAAIFTGAGIAWVGTVQLERSFDGGSTWIVCNIGGAGALAQYTAGPVSFTFGEPEKEVLYRLNAIAYTSGTINYRFSETGGAAESLAIGPLSGG